MDCASCREELSARLDDEGDPEARCAVEAHLAGCPSCRAWEDRAAEVTRRVRVTPAEPAPDLVARALLAAPRPQSRWWRLGPRIGLAFVGALQVVLGLAAVVGADVGHGSTSTTPGVAVFGAGVAHMNHETAAWNVALGAAFLAGSWWRRHLAGLLPALGVFIAVLTVLSALDLAAGRVEPDRVLSHGVLVVGFVLSVVVARSVPDGGSGPLPDAFARTGPVPVSSTSGPRPAPDCGSDTDRGLGPVAHASSPASVGEHRPDVA